MHRDKPQATPSTHTYTNINSSPKPSIKQDSYTNNSSQSSSSANGSKGIINLGINNNLIEKKKTNSLILF